MYTCEHCKKDFPKKNSSENRFCSRECYWLWMKGKKFKNSGQFKKGQPSPRKGKFKTYTCNCCGIVFRPKSKGKDYKYCSRACYAKGVTGVAKPTLRKVREIRKCEECSKAFVVPVKNKNKRFCNKKCVTLNARKKCFEVYKTKEALEKRIKAKIRKHIKRAERVVFGETLRKYILFRDNYNCVLCGSGGELHVDHIKSWAKHPELRFDPNNCRTLCCACHYRETYGKEISDKTQAWGRNLYRRIGK